MKKYFATARYNTTTGPRWRPPAAMSQNPRRGQPIHFEGLATAPAGGLTFGLAQRNTLAGGRLMILV